MQTSEGEPMPILEGDSHNKSSWTNPTTPVVQPSYLHYIKYLPEVMKGDYNPGCLRLPSKMNTLFLGTNYLYFIV